MSTHRLTVAGNRLGRGIPVLDPLPFSTMVTALARRLSLLRFPDIGGGNGGETGIRTLGGLAPTTVFETAPFDHSGTSPRLGRGQCSVV